MNGIFKKKQWSRESESVNKTIF